MTMPDDPDQAFTVVYDSDEGQVVVNDFGVKHAIEVRQGLVDQAVRYAAIVELEKLGYTVTPPTDTDTAYGRHRYLGEHECSVCGFTADDGRAEHVEEGD